MRYFSLLLLVIFPPIVAFSLVFGSIFFEKNKKRLRARLRDAINLNPNTGLASQRILWLCIVLPILYFVVLGVPSWAGYYPSITGRGFSTFFEISTLPLAVLSTIIPLCVLVSRLHSTEQTAAQIKVVSLKNNIDVFYVHRKALFEYFEKVSDLYEVDEEHSVNMRAHPALHKYAFYGATPESGMPQRADYYFEMLDGFFESARTFTHHTLVESEPNKQLAFYKAACDALWSLSRHLLLQDLIKHLEENSFAIKEKQRKLPEETYTITVGNTDRQLVEVYRYCKEYYIHLCNFCGYKSKFLKSIESDASAISMVDGGRRYMAKVILPVENLISKVSEYMDVVEV